MGEGGFGAVYRGMQPDGTEIAVKAPLELGRGSTFVFVQTCPSCQHLRLKSHVQRPANLVYTERMPPNFQNLGVSKRLPLNLVTDEGKHGQRLLH